MAVSSWPNWWFTSLRTLFFSSYRCGNDTMSSHHRYRRCVATFLASYVAMMWKSLLLKRRNRSDATSLQDIFPKDI